MITMGGGGGEGWGLTSWDYWGRVGKESVCFYFEVITLSAPNAPYDLLLNSPKLSQCFPCKHVGRILFFILDELLCMSICLILITKQLILCG